MPDVFTKAKRSAVMSRIRGHGNKETEIVLMNMLRQNGITGWRRNQKVFGKPDFLFREARLALFVDGCFWHGCPRCKRFPSSNVEFWTNRIETNRRRDRRVGRALRKEGWAVLRVWECSVSKERSIRRIRGEVEARSRELIC